MTTTAPATPIEIRKAHALDRAAVSAALAAAFHDDPVFAWVHPELDGRAARFASSSTSLSRRSRTTRTSGRRDRVRGAPRSGCPTDGRR